MALLFQQPLLMEMAVVQRLARDLFLLIRVEPATQTIEAVERLPLLHAPQTSEDVAIAASRKDHPPLRTFFHHNGRTVDSRTVDRGGSSHGLE